MTINEVLKRMPKINDLLKNYCYAKIYGADIDDHKCKKMEVRV